MTLSVYISFPPSNSKVDNKFCAYGMYGGAPPSTTPFIGCMYMGQALPATTNPANSDGNGDWQCTFDNGSESNGSCFSALIFDSSSGQEGTPNSTTNIGSTGNAGQNCPSARPPKRRIKHHDEDIYPSFVTIDKGPVKINGNSPKIQIQFRGTYCTFRPNSGADPPDPPKIVLTLVPFNKPAQIIQLPSGEVTGPTQSTDDSSKYSGTWGHTFVVSQQTNPTITAEVYNVYKRNRKKSVTEKRGVSDSRTL
jgi:hypothetical protein